MFKAPEQIFLVDKRSDLTIVLDSSKADAVTFEFPNGQKIEFAGLMMDMLGLGDHFNNYLNSNFLVLF